MTAATKQQRVLLDGAVGKIEMVVNDPGQTRRGISLVAHPHPLFGGTLDNKVAQTLAKSFVELGYLTIRPNFRGVGESAGQHDEGRGETDDLLTVVDWAKTQYGNLPLILAGFSFGGYVQLRVAQRVTHEKLVLIAPAVGRLDPSMGKLEHINEAPSHTLIVHGDEDDVVQLQSVIDWAKPLHLPIVLLPGAGHFFHGRLTQLKQIVQNACAPA
jgi:alpha/beta superfamily hydrolase